MNELRNRNVLITGGASGLGLAVVRRFVAEGAQVAVLDRSEKALDALKKECGVETFVGDVRDYETNARAVSETVERFGRLDVFIANAGVYDNRATLSGIPGNMLGEAFDELFGINVKGYLLGARAALGPLSESGGTIIFTASVSGLHPGFGGALYVAAKHAIVGLTRQLAWELAPSVRVNAVAPGYVPTQLGGLTSLGQGKSGTGPKAEQLPLNVIPDADDYTGCYILLASEAGARIATGTVLLADGGLSLSGPGLKNFKQEQL